MEEIKNQFSSSTNLELTEPTKMYLMEMAKWAKFISIISIISVVFLIISGFCIMLMGSMFPFPGFVGFVYIVLGGIMIYPALKLYGSTQEIQAAVPTNNSIVFETAMDKMKAYWKFMGIYTIVVIGLVLLFTIFSIFSSVFTFGRLLF